MIHSQFPLHRGKLNSDLVLAWGIPSVTRAKTNNWFHIGGLCLAHALADVR